MTSRFAWAPSHPSVLNVSHSHLPRGSSHMGLVEQRSQFGEMFYLGLFWNRTMKDIGIGSFLSLGWNLGFARGYVAEVAKQKGDADAEQAARSDLAALHAKPYSGNQSPTLYMFSRLPAFHPTACAGRHVGPGAQDLPAEGQGRGAAADQPAATAAGAGPAAVGRAIVCNRCVPGSHRSRRTGRRSRAPKSEPRGSFQTRSPAATCIS